MSGHQVVRVRWRTPTTSPATHGMRSRFYVLPTYAERFAARQRARGFDVEVAYADSAVRFITQGSSGAGST
jgi:hypothetical protein